MPGSRSSIPISGVDILPTIQDLVSSKVEYDEKIDGGSFKKNFLEDPNSKVSRNCLLYTSPSQRDRG